MRIVNVARGGLLDYGAVKARLVSEHIGGLGLDVQWHEPVDPDDYFASHPKCDSALPPLTISLGQSHAARVATHRRLGVRWNSRLRAVICVSFNHPGLIQSASFMMVHLHATQMSLKTHDTLALSK